MMVDSDPACRLCGKLRSAAKPHCGDADDGNHDFPAEEVQRDEPPTAEDGVVIAKFCTFCFKSELEAKPHCGDTEDGKHNFEPLEVVTREVAERHQYSCTHCPDAELYDGERPNMRIKKAGGPSYTCRNPKCDHHSGYAKALDAFDAALDSKPMDTSSQGQSETSSAKRPRRGSEPPDFVSNETALENVESIIKNFEDEERDLVNQLGEVRKSLAKMQAVLKHLEKKK